MWLVCCWVGVGGCSLYFEDAPDDAGSLCHCLLDARPTPPPDAYVPVCRDAGLTPDAAMADAGLPSDASVLSDAGAGGRQTGCAIGQGCYVNIFELGAACFAPDCDAQSSCGHGDTCQSLNGCHPGKTCSALNEAQDSVVCAKLCDASFADGLTESDLPLPPDSIHNGVPPWSCDRDDDGPGDTDTPLAYPQYVCIPLGGDGPIRYWGVLSSADGWPFGANVGICVDVESPRVNGNPYTMSAPASAIAIAGRPATHAHAHAHDHSCNPATNLGCGPGEKCGVVVIEAGAPPRTSVDCVPDGTKQPGEACTIDGHVACGQSGYSDCGAGTECMGGQCLEICEVGVANSCADGYCEAKPEELGAAWGVCRPACDPTGVAGP